MAGAHHLPARWQDGNAIFHGVGAALLRCGRGGITGQHPAAREVRQNFARGSLLLGGDFPDGHQDVVINIKGGSHAFDVTASDAPLKRKVVVANQTAIFGDRDWIGTSALGRVFHRGPMAVP